MDNPATATPDRRVAPRRRVLKPVRIIYNNGQRAIDCVLRDISDTGAQIDTERVLELPTSFWLSFQDGRTRPVELVRQNSNLLGVRFVDAPQLGAGAPVVGAAGKSALLARVDEIQRQLSDLRAVIAAGLTD